MGRGAWWRLGTLAVASCLGAGCTAAGTHQARHPATARPTVSASPSGVIGSAGNPLTLGCGQQAYDGAPLVPGPRDLVIGPLDIIGGKVLATADPAGYGEHGDYKVPVAVGPGATVRVVIGPPARGHVVIQNPYGPSGGVAAAVYHSCSAGWTVFPQSFAFLGQRTRGCVPLEVQAAGQAKARHVTVSLFAGRCRP